MENKAGLNLLPRKEFELILSDGTVCKGRFGTWALARFGQKKKLSLSDITLLFTGNPQIMEMVEYVICAVEYMERKEKKPPFMNELIFGEWVDDYFEATKEPGVLMKLMLHESSEYQEKKSDQELKEGQTNGKILSEISAPLAEA